MPERYFAMANYWLVLITQASRTYKHGRSYSRATNGTCFTVVVVFPAVAWRIHPGLPGLLEFKLGASVRLGEGLPPEKEKVPRRAAACVPPTIWVEHATREQVQPPQRQTASFVTLEHPDLDDSCGRYNPPKKERPAVSSRRCSLQCSATRLRPRHVMKTTAFLRAPTYRPRRTIWCDALRLSGFYFFVSHFTKFALS